MTAPFATDEWLRKHLQDWADRSIPAHERESAVAVIIDFCERTPAVFEEDYGWPTIYELAKRERGALAA